MKALTLNGDGTSLVELLISMVVFATIALSLLSLFTTLVFSAAHAKQVAVASALATNQMEYLKSLPYDNLAVAGGSIYSAYTIPGTATKTVNGLAYIVTTSIDYVDDAYDGCASYPNMTLEQQYCRNYPPPSSAPSTDTNPDDYKILHVSVTNKRNLTLASVDTTVSARVAETASNTGAMFVSVLDSHGNPVPGASVAVTDPTISPAVNLSDSTDGNGVAVFYGLPPDSNAYDYQITGSLSGYSTLSTIIPSGSLQPTYSSQEIFAQKSAYVTLTLNPQGANSLVLEATDTSGNPLANAKIYVKGGYKKYTASTDTTYYYDNVTPSDTRPTTDSGGLASVSNLAPGNYIFCGDAGATSCSVGSTTYYLAAAVPYGGVNPFNPIKVPSYAASNPPTTTYAYGGNNYLQKVRLMLTTQSAFPRVSSISPYDASQASGTLSNFSFVVNGTNLPCSSTASSCSTTVKFTQASSSFPASCTGDSNGTQLTCTVNLSSASQTNTQMSVTANGLTLTLPTSPPMGGIVVTP